MFLQPARPQRPIANMLALQAAGPAGDLAGHFIVCRAIDKLVIEALPRKYFNNNFTLGFRESDFRVHGKCNGKFRV